MKPVKAWAAFETVLQKWVSPHQERPVMKKTIQSSLPDYRNLRSCMNVVNNSAHLNKFDLQIVVNRLGAEVVRLRKQVATLRERARESEVGTFLWSRCYACGHRLRFSSSACPQCNTEFDGRKEPKAWPDTCQCERCQEARLGGEKGGAA